MNQVEQELSHYIDVLTRISQGISGKTGLCVSELQEMHGLIGRMEGVKNSLAGVDLVQR